MNIYDKKIKDQETKIEEVEELLDLEKKVLIFLQNGSLDMGIIVPSFSKETTMNILASTTRSDGMMINEISEKYRKLGLTPDPRTIYTRHIECLLKDLKIERTNPEVRRSKRYRIIPPISGV